MYSKTTDNLKLPIWQPLDHPDFLTDLNDENRILDENLHKALIDTDDLKTTVDAITVRMTAIEADYAEMKEKVDSLVELDQNPVFIALQERVATTEVDIQQLKVITGNHTDALVEVKKNLTDMQAMLEDHANELEDHHNSIESLVTLTSKLNTNFGELQTQFEILENQVDSNTTKIVSLENRADKTEGDINGLTDRVGQLNTEVSTLESEMDTVQDAYRSLESDVTKNTNDIASLSTVVEDNTEDIAEMKPTLSAIGEKVDDITATSSTVEQELNALKPQVQKNTADITTVQDNIDTINQTDATQNQNISNLSGRVDALEAGGGGTTPDLTAFEQRVKAVEDDQARQDDSITALENGQSEQETKITALESGQSEQSTKITALETEKNSIDMRVETLEDDNVQTKADLTGLNTAVTGNQTAISNLDSRVDALEAGTSSDTREGYFYDWNFNISGNYTINDKVGKITLSCAIRHDKNIVFKDITLEPYSDGMEVVPIPGETTIKADIYPYSINITKTYGDKEEMPGNEISSVLQFILQRIPQGNVNTDLAIGASRLFIASFNARSGSYVESNYSTNEYRFNGVTLIYRNLTTVTMNGGLAIRRILA